MKDTELKPCTNCGKMIQSDGTELCCSCYAKWKETLPEENAKLRTRIAELEAYRIDGVSLKTIKAVNESLRLRIAELEKLVKDWQEIACDAGKLIEEFWGSFPSGRESDIERVLYDVSKAPKGEK